MCGCVHVRRGARALIVSFRTCVYETAPKSEHKKLTPPPPLELRRRICGISSTARAHCGGQRSACRHHAPPPAATKCHYKMFRNGVTPRCGEQQPAMQPERRCKNWRFQSVAATAHKLQLIWNHCKSVAESAAYMCPRLFAQHISIIFPNTQCHRIFRIGEIIVRLTGFVSYIFAVAVVARTRSKRRPNLDSNWVSHNHQCSRGRWATRHVRPLINIQHVGKSPNI